MTGHLPPEPPPWSESDIAARFEREPVRKSRPIASPLRPRAAVTPVPVPPVQATVMLAPPAVAADVLEALEDAKRFAVIDTVDDDAERSRLLEIEREELDARGDDDSRIPDARVEPVRTGQPVVGDCVRPALAMGVEEPHPEVEELLPLTKPPRPDRPAWRPDVPAYITEAYNAPPIDLSRLKHRLGDSRRATKRTRWW